MSVTGERFKFRFPAKVTTAGKHTSKISSFHICLNPRVLGSLLLWDDPSVQYDYVILSFANKVLIGQYPCRKLGRTIKLKTRMKNSRIEGYVSQLPWKQDAKGLVNSRPCSNTQINRNGFI